MRITRHSELEVYKRAFSASMRVFSLSKRFPKEETYSLTDQIRRSSRSVCSNLAEAWRKPRYEAAFIAKLADSEAEAAETQVWLEFALSCEYLDAALARELTDAYDSIISTLVGMATHPETWIITRPPGH